MNYTYRIKWSLTGMSYYGVRYKEGKDESALMTSYFTSSKYVKSYIIENGLPDVVQIRKIFETKLEAKQWEERVIDRGNLYKLPENWLNRGNNGSFKNVIMDDIMIQKIKDGKKNGDKTKKVCYNNGIVTKQFKITEEIPENFVIGRILSEKQSAYLKNMSENVKKRDPESVRVAGRKISAKTKGKKKPDGFGDALSKKMTGVKRPNQTGDNNVSRRPDVREKISKSWDYRENIRWFNNIETGEVKWVYEKDVSLIDTNIWVKGRPTKGAWYNDGMSNIWISLNQDSGILLKGKIFKKRKWITNGVESYNILYDLDLPPGFVLGRTTDPKLKNTKYYCNDGVKNYCMLIGDPLPENCVLGRKKVINQ